MRIIFLDIDGVLNHDEYYEDKFTRNLYPNPMHDNDICPRSVERLNRLTGAWDAKIVLSSTWRLGKTVPEIQDMFNRWGITGELWGKTPRFEYVKTHEHLGSVLRGKEIEYWLETKLNYKHVSWDDREHLNRIDESGLEQYIILDDDTDMTYNQRHHFIKTSQATGLDDIIFRKAKDLLRKSIKEINSL